ncbi:unnamed protein product, partial [Closterium sp. NIES-65]
MQNHQLFSAPPPHAAVRSYSLPFPPPTLPPLTSPPHANSTCLVLAARARDGDTEWRSCICVKGSFKTIFHGQVDEWLGELVRGSRREVAAKVLHTESMKAFDDCPAEILVLGNAGLLYELAERGSLHHWLHSNSELPLFHA